ncbi:MAG: hypothetical protein K9N07_10320 [Candidatus Cloacimonetes bacterium]|nr:hypothetical protein [Candidatus Cloacimonadota bacterium]
MPEWMFNQLRTIKQHSGQSQNAIVRLALVDYIKRYNDENKLMEVKI